MGLRRAAYATSLFVSLLGTAAQAQSADELATGNVAVLVPKILESAKGAVQGVDLASEIRVSIKEVLPSVQIISNEKVEVLLRANPDALCDSECDVETGRKIGADLLVNGEVARIGGKLKLSLRLVVTSDASLVGAASLVVENADELQLKLPAVCARLFEALGARVRTADDEKPGPEQGLVSIVCEPKARVLIDGDSAGLTPLRRAVGAGVHLITLAAFGFKPVKSRVEVKAGGTSQVAETLQPETVMLELAGLQQDATFYLDDNPVPAGHLTATVGAHRLRAERSGFESEERKLALRAGPQTKQVFDLKPLPGRISVRAPYDVFCRIDAGSPLPVQADRATDLKATPGFHTLHCTKPGFEDLTQRVQVPNDAMISADVRLTNIQAAQAGKRNGWIALGGAVLAGGVAAYGHFSAASAHSDLAAEDPTKPGFDPTQRDSRQAAVDRGNKLLIGGAAVAGVAAVLSLYFFTWSY